MSRVLRKPAFCICENKDSDQLRGNREADQHLCFRFIDSTIPLLPKSEISNLWPSSVAVQPGLCGTWSETPKTGFLRTRLKWLYLSMMLPKDADSIANSEDPDLTAPVEAVVCRSALFAQTHLSGLGPEHDKTKKMIQA